MILGSLGFLGLYIHIPFCVKKCNYCDFNSFDNLNELKQPYTNALIKEINDSVYNDVIDSVFIGGGTPTSLDISMLIDIINAVKSNFTLQNAEFTVEVNPATLDKAGFIMLKNAGVNRISFGLQSANDDELLTLGRIHTYIDFEKSYNLAVECGFDNINVDLMFSLPSQNLEKWSYTLEKVVGLSPQHISCYSLIVEENTPFYEMDFDHPTEDIDREIYDYTIKFLSENGYKHYEISNFAKENKECQHNIKYWRRGQYIGFGAGAHSLYNDVRFENEENIEEYIRNNCITKTSLTKEEIISEYIFLGLRMTNGISLKEFYNLFGIDFTTEYADIISKYTALNLMKIDDRCYLTIDGLNVSNKIMAEFL